MDDRTMRQLVTAIAVVCWGLCPVPAQADLISVSGPNSTLGVAPAIIQAPASILNHVAFNEGQQGFNERQGVLLQANLAVDGGFIGAGTRVDSHMIFLNLRDVSSTWHADVVWTFSGKILGVMSDRGGSLEAASTPILGALGTNYPAAGFSQRGMEANDGYSGVGTNALKVKMHVIQPGDWIRVVTEHHVIPEPASLWLLGIGLVGLFAERRRRSL